LENVHKAENEVVVAHSGDPPNIPTMSLFGKLKQYKKFVVWFECYSGTGTFLCRNSTLHIRV